MHPDLSQITSSTTASGLENESARGMIREQGAFDLITIPFKHEETISAICLVLWQSKLRDLIACKERAFERYRDQMIAYPLDNDMNETFRRTLSAVEESIRFYEQTILRIEESSMCFSDFATKVEYYSRKRALEHLGTVPK